VAGVIAIQRLQQAHRRDLFEVVERHSIDVRAKRPGLTVRARLNYLASHDVVPNAEADRLAFDSRAAWPELTAEGIDAAIKDGAAGKALEAPCSATSVFPGRRYEDDATIHIVARGPIGRIMQAALDARERRLSFDARQVTPEMRAPVLQVAAEVHVPPVPVIPPTAMVRSLSPPLPAPLTSMRLRGRAPTQIELLPIGSRSIAPAPGQLRQSPTLAATFDLAAFKALPGAEVAVLVTSRAGERRCSLLVSDVKTIR
jgi:hypothetical protein